MTDPVPLLEVRDLVVRYRARGLGRRQETIHAVNGVSFRLHRGETLGLVGESGSGKSTLARCLLALQRPDGGSVSFAGQNVHAARGAALRALRRRMQMVFQDPYGSLNPRHTVGAAIAEGLTIHRLAAGARLEERVRVLLREVGLDPDAAQGYPHAFSGGQRQRIAIARALAVQPDLLLCDEPVSALDVSVQAQIVNLLADLQAARGLSLLFIAHDLGVVRQVAHRIAVLYAGVVVEIGDAERVIADPAHPYTRALVSAVPSVEAGRPAASAVLPGEPPVLTRTPVGCPFAGRCNHARRDQRCDSDLPLVRPIRGRQVACHHVRDEEEDGA